jgi:hypothetical protein
MTGFDDRQKGFENKYKHDEELKFKVNARRNKLLGEWAGRQLGLAGDELDAYIGEHPSRLMPAWVSASSTFCAVHHAAERAIQVPCIALGIDGQLLHHARQRASARSRARSSHPARSRARRSSG